MAALSRQVAALATSESWSTSTEVGSKGQRGEGEKRRECKFQNKAHWTFDRRNNSTRVVKLDYATFSISCALPCHVFSQNRRNMPMETRQCKFAPCKKVSRWRIPLSLYTKWHVSLCSVTTESVAGTLLFICVRRAKPNKTLLLIKQLALYIIDVRILN